MYAAVRHVGGCMGRFGWRFGGLLTLASCVIYPVPAEPEPDDDDDVVGAPDAPDLPSSVALRIDEGMPGELLRTTLLTEGEAGFDDLVGVRFERDITVVDAVFESRDVDLVVSIAVDAAPGEVDLVAQFEQGASLRQGGAFTILPAAPPSSSGDTGTTEAP